MAGSVDDWRPEHAAHRHDSPWPASNARVGLVSSYVVRVKTMWRQAPITAAIVIASAVASQSSPIGIMQGLHRVAEVVFGCVVGLIVSLVMSRVWLIPVRSPKTG